MPLSTEVKDVADVIAKDLANGAGTRQTIGSPTVAFGWVGGMPITLASFVATQKAASMTVPVTRVTPSPTTPVAVVPPAGPKPAAVNINAGTIALLKFSGKATVTLEQTIDGGGLLNAVSTVLGAGSLLAFEAQAMTVLDAQAGQTATGADWAAAIVAGQAAVLGQGGNPGVVAVSWADYPDLIGAIAGSAGFAQDPASAIGSYLGSALHVSPKLATGKAFVMDPQSVAAIEHVASPLLITDPFSGAGTNQITLVSDLVANVEVLNAQHVCEVSIGAAAGRAGRSKS